MTDPTAAPKPGWYVIYRDGLPPECVWQYPSGLFALPTHHASDLPPGWTIGPSVADLLRDAARYRWLREPGRLSEVFVGDSGDALNVDGVPPECIDALIDGALAHDAEGGDRG